MSLYIVAFKIKDNNNEQRSIKLKPLTRGEIKKLEHYSYLGPINITVENADTAIDELLTASLAKSEMDFLDDCSLKTVKKVWDALVKINYGDEEEEKN